jgi:hypothetical protein
MSVLRRAFLALGLMAAATVALRLGGKRSSPRVVGGWRALSGPTYR